MPRLVGSRESEVWAPQGEHVADFYREEGELVGTASDYAREVLDYPRQAFLWLGTGRHCDLFRRALLLGGIDVARATEDGRIAVVPVEDLLPRFLVDGTPHRSPFRETMRPLLSHAGRGGRFRPLHVFGELGNVLLRQGRTEATLRLEELWNELQRDVPFDLHCAFEVHGSAADMPPGPIRAVLREHATVKDAASRAPWGAMPPRRMPRPASQPGP